MPRKPRKRIEFTEDSLQSLLDEIYNEACNERARALNISNRTIKLLDQLTEKDEDEQASTLAMLSNTLKDQQKLVQESIGKKHEIAKIVKSIIEDQFKESSKSNDTKETFKLSPKNIETIRKQIDKNTP